jgi:cysteinyl-tRNA synthetase
VRYWVHNGFVNVDSEKMSKSLGNFFTIREATAVYAPVALRFWLLVSCLRKSAGWLPNVFLIVSTVFRACVRSPAASSILLTQHRRLVHLKAPTGCVLVSQMCRCCIERPWCWLQGTHYRAAVNYTQRALEEASERLYAFYQAVQTTGAASNVCVRNLLWQS